MDSHGIEGVRASGNSQERRRQAAAPGEGLIDALWRKSWRDAGSSSHDSPQALPRQDWHHQLDESTQDEVSTLADPMSRAHAALPDMSNINNDDLSWSLILFFRTWPSRRRCVDIPILSIMIFRY